MKKKGFFLAILCLCQLSTLGRDTLIFGNATSERHHALSDSLTESYLGGMNETARRMLPGTNPDWCGGAMRFRMKVDGKQQNYFTVRCWGSESDNTMVMLFIDGKQVGYRHLGDYDLLHRGNGQKPCLGKFYYYTVPLPIKYTQGKTEVQLELRSYGNTFDYGSTFDTYQKKMGTPTIGFYRAYIDTQACFMPDKKEKQGRMVWQNATIRQTPGVEVLDQLKDAVSSRINRILNKEHLGQQETWLLADAYSVKWTPAYKSAKVITQVTKSIDEFYEKYLADPKIIYTDGSVYNCDWMTTCILARSIRALWKELNTRMDDVLSDGKTRREAWATVMKASLDYGTTHRRQYTNQSMIIDMALYECNRAMMLLNAKEALPEYQTLHYLYESLGLAPWLGKETENGPEMPLGKNYMQLTTKGLTKELGFVGYYGEVLDWVNHIYKTTSMPGMPYSGDAKIREQLLHIAGARYHFRYPALDEEGNRCFRAEAVVGWRDGNHYPGDLIYADRGTAWDATPLMTATNTLDPLSVGIAQQQLKDNQFFTVVAQKVKDANNIRTLQSCLHIPDEYELISQLPASNLQLPMSISAPDYIFSDEEDGVVAIKNGDEILYASLYWRARNAVNNLAKVHYITLQNDRLANVRTETKFTDSGMRYTRPDWVNLGFANWREWYHGIHSAHAGEVLPIAKIPDNVKFKPGDENAYAGRADFYQLKYGKYIIAMNSSIDKTFDIKVPTGKKVVNLSDGRKTVKTPFFSVAPRTTLVLYIDD